MHFVQLFDTITNKNVYTIKFSLHSHPTGTDNIRPSGWITKAQVINGKTANYESNPRDSDLRTMLSNFQRNYLSKHYIYHKGVKQLIYYALKTATNKHSQNEQGRRVGIINSASQMRKIIIGR